MRRLPLYEDELALVEQAEPLALNHSCDLCALSKRKGNNVCLPAEGEPGGLLIVGEGPSKFENDSRRPFVGMGGKLLREKIKAHWKGPVAYDYAVRCMPGREGPSDKSINRCRGYLAKTLKDVQPTRILAIGGLAAKGLFGRNVQTYSCRRSWSYLPGMKVPVFFLIPPGAATRNRFVRQWWEADMEWALTTPAPPPPPWKAMVNLVQTAEESRQVVAELFEDAKDGQWFSFDVETCGALYSDFHHMTSLAICSQDSDDAYVWTANALKNEQVLKPLRRFFADPSIKKIGQNVKFDAQVIEQRIGTEVAGLHADTRLMRKLLFVDADAHLNVMAELVGMGGMKEEATKFKVAVSRAVQYKKWDKIVGAAIGPVPHIQRALQNQEPLMRYVFGMIPTDALYRYNARDTVSTAKLGNLLEGQVRKEPSLARTWQKILKPSIGAIEQIERWGILADRKAIADFTTHLNNKLAPALQEIAKHVGFNPKSPQQVAHKLFTELKLKPSSFTDSGAPSTDEEALAVHAKKHPLVDAMIAHRKYTKSLDTYAVGMLEHVKKDGRIHPSFNIDGARSGRMSCSEPNLQNIPRAQSVEGKMARDCFAVPEGFVMLQADYSQLELRIAAALSGDPLMKAIFEEGVDYHQRTAEMISMMAWGIPPSQVTKDHRSQAKTVNFSMLFGAGDFSLSMKLGISKEKAARLKNAVFGNFKLLSKYMHRQAAMVKKHGEVWTWWEGQQARRRVLWKIADPNDHLRSQAEHGSWNTPIQGTASDFCLSSLIALVDWIREEMLDNDVKLICTVHDSLIFEVRESMVDEVARKVTKVMTQWDSLGVPLVVDLEVGKQWGSLKEYVPLVHAA